MQVSGSRQMHAQENEAHFGGVRRKDADFGDADFGDVRQKDANLQSLSDPSINTLLKPSLHRCQINSWT